MRIYVYIGPKANSGMKMYTKENWLVLHPDVHRHVALLDAATDHTGHGSLEHIGHKFKDNTEHSTYAIHLPDKDAP